jgi:cobalt-zinc-cadmium efflux system membrane fusion protein
MSRLAVCVAVALAACGGKETSGSAPSASAAGAPAVEGAMCGEHGVLMAICTKHNPRLIPVFQAKGDWCPEHGFPMSVCPIHHPERGGKPQAKVGKEEAPPDGTKVRFKKKEIARLAGIKTVAAEARPGGARLSAIATIAYDATREAAVNARAAGVVRALKADLGQWVEAGAPLAVIESAAVGSDRSRLGAAATRLAIADENHRREQELFAKGIAAQKDVRVAEERLAEARAEAAAARAATGVVGKGTAGAYTLTAPIAGTVVRRGASLGRMVDAEEVLFEIVDTRAMWADVEIRETDLALVAVGQPVTIRVDVLGDRAYQGTLATLAPEVNPRTRTTRARVALENADGALRANMFARAEIALGGLRPTVMVPRAAVQRVKDVALCFVRVADDVFEVRRVKLGHSDDERVEIASGVAAGELVATEGSFLLKTETLKGSIGAGCCE